ncbi:MAG: LAGLIDADG family homing endonuclease [Desulfobacteraceae bacterium]|jgi:ribonucleotide reductase alpha subunit
MPKVCEDAKSIFNYVPYFCRQEDNPYDLVEWSTRDVILKDHTGKIIFEQKNVEAPQDWSDQAVCVTVQKYFYGKLGTPQRETSIRQLIQRVVNTIRHWALDQGYFANQKVADAFCNDLIYLLLTQQGSFNSPIWFNLGIKERTAQVSACFITSVQDNMESITDLQVKESAIFKGGSGSGVNLSAIRGSMEYLSNGGIASGPVSFMKGYDAWAGTIKSGGATRRAAAMRILNDNHPDIMEFVQCKLHEERIAQLLIEGGVSANFDDSQGAYAKIQFQNANHSVRITDDFMQELIYALEYPDKETLWPLKAITTSKIIQQIPILALWKAICDSAWACGEPGLQFDDTINDWHTCPAHGRQKASNPCLHGDSLIMTPTGLKKIKDYVGLNKIMLAKDGKFRPVDIWENGVRSVYKVTLSNGFYILVTEDHPLCSNGEYIEAKNLMCRSIDTLIMDDLNWEGEWFSDTAVAEVAGFKQGNRPFPNKWLTASKNSMAAFLRGLFSANSEVNIPQCKIELEIVNYKLVCTIQQILTLFGIKSYVVTKSPLSMHKGFKLNIPHRYIEKFRNNIGFIQSNKQSDLDTLLNMNIIEDSQVIPKVIEIKYIGESKIYDFKEAHTHAGWVNGIDVHNCGEFCWLDDSACNLASLNLMKFRHDDRHLNVATFRRAVQIFIMAQDILIDKATYPTQKIKDNSIHFRPLGLGYTNLGAFLMSNGIPYDSEKGRNLAAFITSTMTSEAYCTSAKIASYKGAFKGFSKGRETMLAVIKKHQTIAAQKNINWGADWDEALNLGTKYGFRNAQVTLLAPTGTISFMMDCDTTGIEPETSLYRTKQLVGGGTILMKNNIIDTALEILGYDAHPRNTIKQYLYKHKHLEGCPDLSKEHLSVFDCAIPPEGTRGLSPDAHLYMCDSVQPFLSGAISKTINLPHNSTPEDIGKVFIKAWKLGLKSITIYRDRCKQSQPITTTNETNEINKPTPIKQTSRRKLNNHQNNMHRIRFAFGDIKGYVLVTPYEDTKMPGEIFVKLSKEGSTISGLVDGWARSISYNLQYGVPFEILVKQFSYTNFEPSGYSTDPDIKFAHSIYDAIVRKLEAIFITNKVKEKKENNNNNNVDGPPCTVCGTLMIRSGVCFSCPVCGETSGCG